MPPAFIHTGRQLGRGVPKVNWTHPLARSLIAAYVPATAPSGRIINLVSPGSGDLTTRGTASYLKQTPEGLGLDCTVQNAGAWGPAPVQFQVAKNVSVFARGLFAGNSQVNVPCLFIGVSYAPTITSPYIPYGVGSGPNAPATTGSLLAAYEDNTSNFEPIGGTIVPTAKTMVSAGASFVAGITNPNLYTNGVNNTAAGAAHPPAFTYSSPQINLGIWSPDATSSSRIAYMVITVAYIWNRLLTDGEQRYLDTNPYSPLLWPDDQVSLTWAHVSSSTTSVTTDTRSFLEMLGVTRRDD